MTLKSLGLLDTLGQFASRVFPHVPGGASDDERGALSADFYLTSANAVSMDGQIVNIDGTGNRVGATCFGPKHVLYLIGRNKIVRTLDEAISRAKDAAVRLAEYYGRRTPCVETGRCMDCLVDDCICSVTTIHRKKPLGVDMTVFLIDQDLGL